MRFLKKRPDHSVSAMELCPQGTPSGLGREGRAARSERSVDFPAPLRGGRRSEARTFGPRSGGATPAAPAWPPGARGAASASRALPGGGDSRCGGRSGDAQSGRRARPAAAGERQAAWPRSGEQPPEPWQEILSLAFEMMGLGNGRRTMKSPPFVLAALVACNIVLGFNYWIASSRSVDLQTQIMELEGRVRRAAAERGAVELKKNEFQGELEKQREQLDKIQASHNSQMESAHRLHQDEKAILVNNITTGERLIRTLQDQLKALQKNYGKLQQDVLQFQKNQTHLERKFSYDLSQCINQMKELKEQCEEQLEEVTKRGNEAVASRNLNGKGEQSPQLHASNETQPRLQEAGLSQAEGPQGKGNIPSHSKPQTPAPSSEAALDVKGKGEKEETNDIQVGSEEELRRDRLGLPPQPNQEQAVEEDRHAGGRAVEDAGDLGPTPQVPAALLLSQENQEVEEPERDQLVVLDGQEEEQGAGKEGRNQPKIRRDDDYNMDENEAESETDKQAALAGNDRNVNVLNAANQKRDNKFT